MGQSEKSFIVPVTKSLVLLMVLVLAFGYPFSVLATTCATPDIDYIVHCKDGDCSRGFKIEYQYVYSVTICGGKRVIINLTHDELERINHYLAVTNLKITDGIIEFTLPSWCAENGTNCFENITLNKISEGSDFDLARAMAQQEIGKEQLEFYFYESVLLLLRCIPLLIGLLFPYVTKQAKDSKQFWGGVLVLFVLQGSIAGVFLLTSTLGDEWTPIIFFITMIAMFVELVYVFRKIYTSKKGAEK